MALFSANCKEAGADCSNMPRGLALQGHVGAKR